MLSEILINVNKQTLIKINYKVIINLIKAIIFKKYVFFIYI